MNINKIFATSAICLALAGCQQDNGGVNRVGTLTITGTTTQAETLTAVLRDEDGFDAGAVTYTWLAGGNVISGATGSTYTLTAAEGGSTIVVTASYTDNRNNDEGVTSSATGTVEAFVNVEGVLTISGPTIVGETLTSSLTDENGLPDSISYSWAADGTTIEGETGTSLLLSEAQLGTTITVSASYTDGQGFAESVTSAASGTITPVFVNTPATFDGLSATTTNQRAVTTGTVTVTDVDDGESSVIPQADTQTTFGTFTILESGAWTYNLDTEDSTISSLVDGDDSVEDTVVIESADGTEANFVITITGPTSSAGTANAAVIRDTLSTDTGELRYDIDPTLSGRLEVSFTRTATGPGAFIALLNDSGSTSSGRSIVDMRIDDDAFSFRDQDVTIPDGLVPTPGTLQTAVITWTAATDADRPTVNVTIDGVAIEAFTSGGSNYDPTDENSGGVGGVERVQFRFGSNSATSDATDTYTINSFEVFSDTDGTTSIFADDFSGYAVGDSLDSDDNANSPYAGNTSEAVVEEIEVPVDSSQVAVIRDTLSTDTGELRYDIDPTLSGRLEVSFTRTATGPGAFIALLNDSGSTSSGRSIVDMRIDDDAFSFRDQDVTIPDGLVPTPGTLQTAVITWTAATDADRPTVNVTIDGVAIEAFTSGGSNYDPTDENSGGVGGVERVQFRFGSNSATSETTDTYTINSFEVFSDTDGITSIFADDFSGYAVGDSLDSDDNANSPYAGNTSEAVVELFE